MAEDAILLYLEKSEEIPDSGIFASEFGIDHEEVINVTKSLNGYGLVLAQDIKKENWVLTEEGKLYAAAGSPEMQVFSAIPPEGISPDELQKKVDPSVFKIGFSQAMKNKWVERGKQSVSRKVQHVDDKVKDLLTQIQAEEVRRCPFLFGILIADIVHVMRSRFSCLGTSNIFQCCYLNSKRCSLINLLLETWKGYSICKGPNYAPKRKKAATDLTREHLQSGGWKDLELKEYNFNAKGLPPEGGHLHPLLKPQQHPARDSHDTFFLKEPSTTQWLPEDYVERVKCVHESGGYGSRGYGYDWKREEANKNLLRTHTTAVSSRMLYKLAQKPFAPQKYFSIDRVFRNEAVDRTHLAEFHQIEGLICDRGLTLGDLIGVLHDFFSRLGMTKLRFKPAYNPYTEPSMEIFSYHEGFGKWVEIGNSGMFRPEMLLPMGLPDDVRVVAWGLSLERPTMILYGIDNIRDLFGHKVDLGLMKKNPICRIGLE
uniref:phenylalanine--tRNA ligase n=1 Tax=Chenopodium quinoa TaxID=63459 RepID=A0A803KVV7_CHEQI